MTEHTFKTCRRRAAREIFAFMRDRKDFDGKLAADTMLEPEIEAELFARIEAGIEDLIREAHQPLIDEIERLARAATRLEHPVSYYDCTPGPVIRPPMLTSRSEWL